MKTTILSAAAAFALVSTALTGAAFARDTMQIAGSSTVLPFASIVAEEFGNAFPGFNTPVVGGGGSSGGLRQFCEGVGDSTIDIANASRPIKSSEVEACGANGVKQILEVQVGYDGIVFASRADRADFKLEPKFVFMALAAEMPQDGKLVANPFTRWSEIDPSLPDQAITLVIPGTNHGTREVFEEKVVLPGCDAFEEIKALAAEAADKACKSFRQDGRVVEVSGDYTETLARLDAQQDAVGVFGLSFYEQNKDKLKVATVGGVAPSLDTVASGQYPVSRPLFFYVKGEHIGLVPGIEEYTQFFLSDAVSGMGSPLEAAGLIPLSDDERAKVLADFEARKPVGM